jgi:cobalt-zinc-cadmium resistance protein CzcA
MFNKIIEFSVKQKLIIGLFMLVLIGYGAYEVTRLPIDAVPDITDNQVQVITSAPSYGATDIERLVTFPVEQANSNIPGLKEIRSFSRFGLSVVTIVFDDETDVYWARQQVNERIQAIKDEIPTEIGVPKLGPVTTGLGEIYQYMVRPKKGYEKKYTETELRTIQDWIVRRQLLSVKGVAEVSSFGGRVKQYEIAIDPNMLNSYGITMDEVFQALKNNNQNTGGAYIEKEATVLYIRSEGLIEKIEDIENISVSKTKDGTPLFLRDVADVRLGNATRYGAMTYVGRDGEPSEVSGAVVMMLKGANSNDVIYDIKERIDQIQKTLPEGVVIEPFLDRTKMVNHAIGTVTKNLLEGALIVLFILVLFLGNFRAGIIVASVIPLAMLFAVIMMNLFGVSGNLMSLGALDFGLIVDGAVIIVEACMYRLHKSENGMLNQDQMNGLVIDTSARMRNAAVFGEIIILIVYIPIFTLQGIEGKMFKPMAQTVAFALLGAFVLSLTYIPMMSALFLSKKAGYHPNLSDRMMGWVEKHYRSALTKALKIPRLIVGTTIAVFAVAVIILTRMGGEFIPSLEEGDFAVETRVLTGSNLNTSVTAVSEGGKILLEKFPEVEKVVGKTGSSEVPTDPMPIDASDMMVILKDKSEWTSAKTFDELAEKMSKALEDVPGVTHGFQYPVQMRFNELMTGARQDVVCKIYGEDLDTLALYAKRLGNIVNTVEGTRDLYLEAVTGMPQISIDYNRSAIAQYNLDIADINRVVNTAFAGQSSGLVFEGEKRFDLVVRLSKEKRQNLEDVQNLLIPTPEGTQVPLYQLADVQIKDGPNQVQREDAKRRIVVGFNVRGRDVQSIVEELQGKVEKRLKTPAGYFITYGGAFENLQAAKNRLSIAVPVSLILIFILLYFAFRSIRQGLLIYSAIPLSATGGILFLALRGMPFSISAGVGFIALFGVAVLNGIVLLSEFNRMKKDGTRNLKKIAIEGSVVRLRPVLMTAFVASLGFLPMALSNGSGAEVQRPLATVVIGGLLVATFLTLFVLPILYIMTEKRQLKKGRTPVPATVAVLFLFGIGMSAKAQTPVSLESAIDMALKNNVSVQNERLRATYQQQLVKSARAIPNTTITGEFGQINSIYGDKRVGISQSIGFPTVYTSQRKYLEAVVKSSEFNVKLQEADLKRQVSETYYLLVSIQQKEQLLQRSDSLYASFLQQASQRFNSGESNVLEKVTAENQRSQIRLQMKQLQQEKEVLQLRFQLVLNAETVYVPDASEISPHAMVFDTTALKEHPMMQYYLQQQETARAMTKVERSKLLPELTVGYNIMSMRGTGADNTTYNGSLKFQSVQVGLGIPIFNGGQRSRVQAAQTNEAVIAGEYTAKLQALETEYLTVYSNYRKNQVTVAYYESEGLKNAETITATANQQFQSGDINYLEWVMLMNQAVTIENNYIDALMNRNQSIAELNYYFTK